MGYMGCILVMKQVSRKIKSSLISHVDARVAAISNRGFRSVYLKVRSGTKDQVFMAMMHFRTILRQHFGTNEWRGLWNND